MLWLPFYLKKNSYSSYEAATCASTLDIGNVLGGVIIGYLTDLTYSRRTPIAVVSIILATIMQVFLIVMDPQYKVVFFISIFMLGLLMGGAVAIISGISCADLVTYQYLFLNF
jgi:sugar phosphate permease